MRLPRQSTSDQWYYSSSDPHSTNLFNSAWRELISGKNGLHLTSAQFHTEKKLVSHASQNSLCIWVPTNPQVWTAPMAWLAWRLRESELVTPASPIHFHVLDKNGYAIIFCWIPRAWNNAQYNEGGTPIPTGPLLTWWMPQDTSAPLQHCHSRSIATWPATSQYSPLKYLPDTRPLA